MTARISPFDKQELGNQNMMQEDMQDCIKVLGNIYKNKELLN